MKIKVISFGNPYTDFENVKSFDLLKDYLWIIYEDGSDTFFNRDSIEYFHVMEDDE